MRCRRIRKAEEKRAVVRSFSSEAILLKKNTEKLLYYLHTKYKYFDCGGKGKKGGKKFFSRKEEAEPVLRKEITK